MKTLEIFSGAGGLAKGLELSGFEPPARCRHGSEQQRPRATRLLRLGSWEHWIDSWGRHWRRRVDRRWFEFRQPTFCEFGPVCHSTAEPGLSCGPAQPERRPGSAIQRLGLVDEQRWRLHKQVQLRFEFGLPTDI